MHTHTAHRKWRPGRWITCVQAYSISETLPQSTWLFSEVIILCSEKHMGVSRRVYRTSIWCWFMTMMSVRFRWQYDFNSCFIMAVNWSRFISPHPLHLDLTNWKDQTTASFSWSDPTHWPRSKTWNRGGTQKVKRNHLLKNRSAQNKTSLLKSSRRTQKPSHYLRGCPPPLWVSYRSLFNGNVRCRSFMSVLLSLSEVFAQFCSLKYTLTITLSSQHSLSLFQVITYFDSTKSILHIADITAQHTSVTAFCHFLSSA